MADPGVVRRTEERAGGILGWGLALALALLALMLVVIVARWRPPAAKPKSAPVSEFSGARALAIVQEIEGDGTPHPIGSDANIRVRERILAHLRWLGYAPEVQVGFACDTSGACATTRNVVARLPGREPGKGVLLAAHYDSVPAGPGASDDMSGVATLLEAARVLKVSEQPRHSVIFLIDDGEEAGLLGARAFVAQSPTLKEVGAVVNFEARGTEGPGFMFETSGADGALVGAWGHNAPRPFTSSLSSTVYQYMPNDTDLTVFKNHGIPGLNFAFIGGPLRYHTPRDDVAHASADSLQHQGDNAVAAARGLSALDLDHPHGGRAVYFDLFRRFVIRWPAGASPILALLAFGLTLVALPAVRRGGGGLLAGLLAPLATLVAGVAAGFILRAVLRGAFPAPWIARPQAATVAFWLAALALALGALTLVARVGPRFAGVWTGVWLLWSLFGLALGIALPGVSFLFIGPALVAGVCAVLGLPGSDSGGGLFLAAFLPAAFALLLWSPALLSLYLGLGLMGLLATAVLLSLLLSALAPLAATSALGVRRWLPVLAALGALVAVVVALRTPPFSADAPRSGNLQLHQDADRGEARWLWRGAGPLPEPMRAVASFAAAAPYPWSPAGYQQPAAPAPKLDVVPPELTVLHDEPAGGKRHLVLRLVSVRGAPIGMLLIPSAAEVESVRIDGTEVPLHGEGRRRGPQAGDWRFVVNLTLPPQGSEIDVVLGSPAPRDWYFLDRSYGLPPAGRALLAARPADQVPSSEGDSTLVSKKAKI
jgi:hypothetical protein